MRYMAGPFRTLCMTIIISAFFSAAVSADAIVDLRLSGENAAVTSAFQNGLKAVVTADVGAESALGKGAMKISVEAPASSSPSIYNAQVWVKYPGVLTPGGTYRMSIMWKAAKKTPIMIAVMTEGAPYALGTASRETFIPDEWTKEIWEFEIKKDFTAKGLRLPLMLFGKAEAGTSIWIAAVKVESMDEASKPVKAVKRDPVKMASGRPIVGAIRWDAWHAPKGNNPAAQMLASLGPKQYHWRMPFFARVKSENEIALDGYSPEVIGKEIDYAKRCIDYWAFLLYDTDLSMSDAINVYIDHPRRKEMPFCVIAQPDTFGNAAAFPARMKRVIDYMIDDAYVTVLGGRPLVYLFSMTDEWLKAWGGAANARKLFDDFREAAKTAGSGDPYIVVMEYTPARAKLYADIIGAQAVSSYAFDTGSVGTPSKYSTLADDARIFWEQCLSTRAEVVPIVMAGWDRRPRIEHPVSWERNQLPGVGIEKYYETPTPAELASQIEEAMHCAVENKAKCPAQAVIVYAWNEHDEGGWLCPTRNEDGTANMSRVDAIGAMRKGFSSSSARAVSEARVPMNGRILHLDAMNAASLKKSGDVVSLWKDISGKGNDAVSVNSAMKYVSYPSGVKAVRFDPGKGMFRSGATAEIATVFAVHRCPAEMEAAQYGRILSMYNGTTMKNGGAVDWISPSWCIYVANDKPYDTSVEVKRGPILGKGLGIGGSMSKDGDNFVGEIAEIIVYDRALASDEMLSLLRYLRQKWRTFEPWAGKANDTTSSLGE
ncbi:MAG: hypothetical protein AABZ39_13435 [Spirochaetota bacterium]